MLSLFINFLLAIEILVSLLIILIVLMQRPKSEGLGAAFGGGMTENLFGAQTSNVLAKATRWLGGIFFGLTLLLAILYAKQSRQGSSIIRKAESAAPVAAVSGTAAVSGSSSLLATPAVSGSGLLESGSALKINAPVKAPADTLVPVPSLGGTPAPVATPATKPAATPATSGSTGGH
jgi:preprotein translocase subunit SecG